ncbi:MAG: acyl-CoA dehydrogenase family protein [Rhodospirillaceae bacterium]|nr:acyl-CoA dehydrogenase family protein [Rhodospirillaceae bacterium]MDD9915680.1 acyl-CoA dehydrogenase family protein [Rhodospirillaceae bacterium]
MDTAELPTPLAKARLLAGDIAAAGDEIERTRRIPKALLDKLHEARLCRMLLPRSVDGDEIDPGAYLLTIEEISRHDASVGWNLFVANSAALLAPHMPAEAAQTIFGDPRALVAWGPPDKHVAKAVEGGYRVSGRWSFASGCRNATWMGAHCRVQEPDGSLRKHPDGRSLVLSLLFPVAQAKLIDTWDTIGLRGTASDTYELDDLFVPEAFTGTREHPDDSREPGSLYAFPQQAIYAVGVAGVALGIARAMLEAFTALAAEKTPRGLSRLAESAGVQAGVAKGEARIGSARAYLLEVLREIAARAPRDRAIDVPDRGRVRLATANAIQGSIETADWLYKNAGVTAIFPGSPYERRFRDIHTLSQQIQSRDAHFEAVGSILLGNPPDVFY